MDTLHYSTMRAEPYECQSVSPRLPRLHRLVFPVVRGADFHSVSPSPRKSPMKPRLTIDDFRQLGEVSVPSIPAKLVTLHLPPLRENSAKPSVSKVFATSQTGARKTVQKTHNQDAYFTQALENWRVVGVCDGHGASGHLVSSFLVTHIPQLLSECLAKADLKSAREALISTYAECSHRLKNDPIDSSNSGSTCLTVVILKSAIVCANVGDSRAVLGRNTHGIWSVFQLSWDHKPELPEEMERIVRAGGEVCVSKSTHLGPPRVYLKSRSFPGLSMSRSMGDDVATSVGVTAEPDIVTVRLTPGDKFVIAASDGLWEVMSSMEAVQQVAAAVERGDESASDTLAAEAKARWLRRGTVIDDITIVITILAA